MYPNKIDRKLKQALSFIKRPQGSGWNIQFGDGKKNGWKRFLQTNSQKFLYWHKQSLPAPVKVSRRLRQLKFRELQSNRTFLVSCTIG